MGVLLQVNGVQMNVETREARSARRTLVLLHGFTGSAAAWGSHLEHFAGAELRVVALDLLGHGRSDSPADPLRYQVEQCRRDILGVLDQLGVPQGEAVLLGYSMGGRMALYSALEGYFSALILESASAGIADAREREMRRQADETLADRIEREGIPAFVSYWESQPLFAGLKHLSAQQQALVHEQRLQNTVTGLAGSLRGAGAGSQPALYQDLPALDLPVLLIAGALDAKYAAIARDMCRSLPRAQLEIVPGAGHTVHLERPDVFDRLAERFCNSS